MARHAAPADPDLAVNDATVDYVAVYLCDRCSAPAQIRAVLANGGELLFCGHHARAYRLALAQVDALLEDLVTPCRTA